MWTRNPALQRLAGALLLVSLLDTCGGDLTKTFPKSLMLQRRPQKVNFRLEEKNILDSVMGPKVYDKRIRPSGINGTDAATFVYVNIFVRSFSKIDDVKMEYSFQITMRQKWNDNRLAYKDRMNRMMAERIKYLTLTDASKVWMPDTFFRNEKIGAFHTILTPNLYIRIYPDGDVLYSIRISITCACSMHLALFPLDEQTCNLDIASYGWAKDDLVYIWQEDPVQLAKNLTLPGGFKLGAHGSRICDVVTTTGEYSCLRVKLRFERQLSFFLVTVYVPCSMTVSVSWMSFWLDHKAVPARVALGVTTLLAMSTTQASIQNSLPPVAYTKAIDVWSGVCVFFVFSALLEYALVNYASRSDAQRSVKQKERKKQELERQVFNADHFSSEEAGFPSSLDPLMRRVEGSQMMPPGTVIHHRLPVRRQNKLLLWMTNFQFQAKKIDVFSRVFFPFVFGVFNIWYWSYYLTRANQSEEFEE